MVANTHIDMTLVKRIIDFSRITLTLKILWTQIGVRKWNDIPIYRASFPTEYGISEYLK